MFTCVGQQVTLSDPLWQCHGILPLTAIQYLFTFYLYWVAEVRETLESDMQTLNQYKESFDSIKEVAELDDVGEIIARFLQQEAENFALFNYVTELNGEIESRQEEVNAVQQNIDTMREEQQQTIAATEHELELLIVCDHPCTPLRYNHHHQRWTQQID